MPLKIFEVFMRRNSKWKKNWKRRLQWWMVLMSCNPLTDGSLHFCAEIIMTNLLHVSSQWWLYFYLLQFFVYFYTHVLIIVIHSFGLFGKWCGKSVIKEQHIWRRLFVCDINNYVLEGKKYGILFITSLKCYIWPQIFVGQHFCFMQ